MLRFGKKKKRHPQRAESGALYLQAILIAEQMLNETNPK